MLYKFYNNEFYNYYINHFSWLPCLIKFCLTLSIWPCISLLLYYTVFVKKYWLYMAIGQKLIMQWWTCMSVISTQLLKEYYSFISKYDVIILSLIDFVWHLVWQQEVIFFSGLIWRLLLFSISTSWLSYIYMYVYRKAIYTSGAA